MSGGLWREAGEAVKCLAPKVCKADPDGVSIFFFSSGSPSSYHNIKSADDVDGLWQREHPHGTTDLGGCLDEVFAKHEQDKHGKYKKTTVLVITDGEPNSRDHVRHSLQQAADRQGSAKDLHVSFVQVGDDSGATQFLENLDEGVGAKWDIVDTMKDDNVKASGGSLSAMCDSKS